VGVPGYRACSGAVVGPGPDLAGR